MISFYQSFKLTYLPSHNKHIKKSKYETKKSFQKTKSYQLLVQKFPSKYKIPTILIPKIYLLSILFNCQLEDSSKKILEGSLLH